MKPLFLLPALTAATLFLAPLSQAADLAATNSAPAATAAAANRDSTAPDMDARAQKRADFIKRFDTNGDGKLDDAEKAAAKATIREERRGRLLKMEERMLKRYDKNGDGKLDEAEQTAALADLETRPNFVRRFDLDGDGVLNAQEKATAEAAMRARWAKIQVAANRPAALQPANAAPTQE